MGKFRDCGSCEDEVTPFLVSVYTSLKLIICKP